MSPYLYISDINKQMLSVGIKLFSAGQVQDYGSQMAAATLVLLPIILVFLFCQRFFIESAAIPDHFMPYASLFAFEQNFKAELFK